MLDFPLPKKVKIVKEEKNEGVFEIEGLYPGYGLTLGNALRRVLLSSLSGSAITIVKINKVQHEFSAIDGVLEDVIQIILNLKKIRVKMIGSDSQTLILSAKGEKEILAKDITKNSNVEILNPETHIATLTSKKSELEMVLTVEKGRGYVSSESLKRDKLSIGDIRIDAIFSPVQKVNYEVEDMRVGDRTDFNRLRIYIDTDGSISPKFALKKSSDILINHFQIISEIEVEEERKIKRVKKEEKPKKKETKEKKKIKKK
jgi:DNA-directed RNA polymerase subunit alpha